MKRFRHPGRGAEAVIRSIEIGKAIGNEDRRHEVYPAAAQTTPLLRRILDLFMGHTSVITSLRTGASISCASVH